MTITATGSLADCERVSHVSEMLVDGCSSNISFRATFFSLYPHIWQVAEISNNLVVQEASISSHMTGSQIHSVLCCCIVTRTGCFSVIIEETENDSRRLRPPTADYSDNWSGVISDVILSGGTCFHVFVKALSTSLEFYIYFYVTVSP